MDKRQRHVFVNGSQLGVVNRISGNEGTKPPRLRELVCFLNLRKLRVGCGPSGGQLKASKGAPCSLATSPQLHETWGGLTLTLTGKGPLALAWGQASHQLKTVR